jgi:uncharacterized protein YjbJ (UPF0337 family)
MDSDRITGTAKEYAGKVQSTAGDALGDAKTQADGYYQQAAGQAQQAVGQANDYLRDQPLVAVLVALGLGILIGRLTA